MRAKVCLYLYLSLAITCTAGTAITLENGNTPSPTPASDNSIQKSFDEWVLSEEALQQIEKFLDTLGNKTTDPLPPDCLPYNYQPFFNFLPCSGGSLANKPYWLLEKQTMDYIRETYPFDYHYGGFPLWDLDAKFRGSCFLFYDPQLLPKLDICINEVCKDAESREYARAAVKRLQGLAKKECPELLSQYSQFAEKPEGHTISFNDLPGNIMTVPPARFTATAFAFTEPNFKPQATTTEDPDSTQRTSFSWGSRMKVGRTALVLGALSSIVVFVVS